MGKGMLLLVSVVVLTLGYLLYIPLPAYHKNPWRSRGLAYSLGLAESLAKVAELITGKPSGAYLSDWTNLGRLTVHQSYPELKVQDKVLDGVRVRLYKRNSVTGSSPVVMYFHGGGWMLSGVDSYDGWNVRLALLTNMTIVAVNYRKAPVNPYPVPFEECLKATMFVLERGSELGLDPTRVVVAGDSAGGNLAAAVALRVAQEDPVVVPRLKLQVILCPALQAMTFSTPSYLDMPPSVLSRQRMAFLWANYMGIPVTSNTVTAMLQDRHVSKGLQTSRYGSYVGKGKTIKVKDDFDTDLAGKLDKLVIDPYLSPLMADESLLAESPPAYLVLFEFDILKDEGLMYADRLKSSGVMTETRVVKGQTHPGLLLLTMPMANPDYDEVVEDVAKHIVDKLKNN